MKQAICGALMILSGVLLGLYVAAWVCLVGGIVDVVGVTISVFRGVDLDATKMAFGLVKVLFAAPVGWLIAFCLVVPGWALLATSEY